MCLHGIYSMTREEAQAAISQQPLFAPQNEALQDNEHFKAATPTTLTTRLSQHSDIGRERERERKREGEREKERESQLDLSKPHFPSSAQGGRNSSRLQRRVWNNTDHMTHLALFLLLSLHHNRAARSRSAYRSISGRLSSSLCVNPLIVSLSRPFPLSPSISLSVSKQSGRQSKILITKSLCSLSFYSCWLD